MLKLLLASLLPFTAFAAEDLKIVGWTVTSGITEQQAIEQARAAIHEELAIDEDGKICSIEDMWNWERETPDRGETFAINGYVTGPHAKMGCSSSETYDCRVVFNRPTLNGAWKVEYVECEAGNRYGEE